MPFIMNSLEIGLGPAHLAGARRTHDKDAIFAHDY